jgi:hypothetical protein
MCREVYTKAIEKKGQMLGTAEEPIQIDEALFAGKRKYNHGRFLQGNRVPQSEDSDALLENNRNHVSRIDGPWVFGLKQGLDCRYFMSPALIKRHLCQSSPGNVHKDLLFILMNGQPILLSKSLGFIHSTVNQQENYVNPASGTNIQGIERSWLDAKIKILRKMRGTTELLLQSHLNEYCYRVMRKHSPNLLIDFLNNVKKCVSLNVFSFHHTFGCFHINTETYVCMYSSIKYMNKASVMFRVYRAQFFYGSTQYFLLPQQSITRYITYSQVDHILEEHQ